MALPRLLNPIPVRFLTDYARILQQQTMGGPLKAAAYQLVGNVLARHQIDETVALALDRNNTYEATGEVPDPDPAADPVVDTLSGVVDGILTGQSMEGQQSKIRQYIFNQQERAELITNLLLTKDYQRLVDHLRVRDLLERKLMASALREDLSTAELMAMITMIGEGAAKLESRVQAGASNVSDVMALLNKADYALHLHEDEVKERFKHTTHTGREIVRRVIHKLQKVAAAGKK